MIAQVASEPETNEEYHADTSCVSSSMLKALNESPRIFEGRYITRTIRSEPTAAMELGTAIHTATLEPDLFARDYISSPADCSDRRTKKYKEWHSANVDEWQTVLTAPEYETVKACAAALRSNNVVAMALEAEGICEHSYRWIDVDEDIPCKMRADKVCPAAQVILDVKTISEATQAQFTKQVANFGYHIQQAHYLAGAKHAYGDGNWMFVFAVVETKAPFRCRAFSLDRDAAIVGAETRARLLGEYARRSASGDWSEENERDLVAVSLPKWVK